MDAERWRQIEDLFARALPLPDAEQRLFLQAQTAGDPALASVLFNMLASDRTSSFLDAGATAIAGKLLADSFDSSIGPYRVRSCLGQGGMGVVYLAEHIEWHIPVAIKVPGDAWISPDRIERFYAEQRLLAQLTHPSIARIYEGGTGPKGTPWFAMEYVEGQPITAFARTRNLSAEKRLQLFCQACAAVQYAHSQAIIHRDLKPSNIFVTPTGEVKLLDFGIAKQLAEIGTNATRTGGQPLTIAYAAPEQVSQNRVSIQSDVYSLGVTLYELLTDRLPFDLTGLSPSQAERMIATTPLDKPSTSSLLHLKRTEWADLDVLVFKTLHKDVGQRYGSVDALMRDVDHFLRHEPLDARPDSFVYRLRKFIDRRRIPVVLSFAAALLLSSLVGFFTWRLANAHQESLAQAKRERQVQRFITNLFAGGDQVNGPSKDTRVIDILSDGVDKARQFDNEPLVQADLYNTLGNVYRSLGELDRADSLFRLALTRSTSAAGRESKEVAETLVHIGQLQDDRGQYQLAEATIRRALDISRKLKPAAPVATAQYQARLAGVLIHETHYPEALTLLKQAEPILAKRAEDFSDWLDNLNLQVNVLIQLHRFGEAERMTRYLIDLDKKRNRRLRPDDAEDIINLGQIQELQFQYANAEQSYRQALQIETSWFPEGHPEIANTRRLLAQDLERQHKYEEATSLMRQTLTDLEHTYGPWHRRVAYALRALCHLAYDRHDLAEARADASREIAIYKRIQNDADLPAALSNLADIDMAQKDPHSAEPLYQEAIARFPTTEWADSPIFAHAQLMLGRILLRQRRYSQAAPLLLASLALWKKQSVLQTKPTADTLSALTEAFDDLHQPEKANEYRRQLEALPK